MPGCVHSTIASGATPIGSADRAPDREISSGKSTLVVTPEKRKSDIKSSSLVVNTSDMKYSSLVVNTCNIKSFDLVVNTRGKSGDIKSSRMVVNTQGKIFDFDIGGKHPIKNKEMGKSSSPMTHHLFLSAAYPIKIWNPTKWVIPSAEQRLISINSSSASSCYRDVVIRKGHEGKTPESVSRAWYRTRMRSARFIHIEYWV